MPRWMGDGHFRGRKRDSEEVYLIGFSRHGQRVDVCHGKSRRFVRMVGHFHSKAFEEWGGGASWTGSVPIWSWFGETRWYSYNSSLDERSAGALQTDKASWTGWWPHRQDVGPSHWHHDLENFKGCRISTGPMLCLGSFFVEVATLRRGKTLHGSENLSEGQQVSDGEAGHDKVDRHTIEMAPVALRDGQINGKKLTKMEAREEENVAAIGGLRDPRRAVAKSESLRVVGKRIRAVLDQCITDNLIAKFEENICIDDETVFACRNALAQEFKVNVNCNEVVGYQTELLEATLLAANDNNSATLPKWLRDGFPIGVSQEIQNTGVFPATDDVSAAIKASQVIGTLLEDWDGNVENYQSFYEAGPKAQSELDRLVEDGRAERVENWKQVVDLVGEDAKLTQLACIVKVKDGKEKVRLVVDMRRSGINGQMVLLERVVLPRIPDVAASCRELLKFASSYDQLEFLVCDFSDAFYTLKLHESERKWVICKGLDSSYFVMKCVCFGLACGPLLWARLASWAMRLAQSVALSHESRLQCYVDDPF